MRKANPSGTRCMYQKWTGTTHIHPAQMMSPGLQMISVRSSGKPRIRPPSCSVCVSPNVTTPAIRLLTASGRPSMARCVMAAP